MSLTAPFGLAMGMQLSEFAQPLRELAPFKFALDVPPKPHPAFAFYLLQITPKCGLSWIKAIGHDIATNGYGIELKRAFESMEGKLANAYGSNRRSDFLLPDSIWNEQKDWMMALSRNERVLGSTWDQQSRASLTPALQSIYLVSCGKDNDTGFIAIEYALKSFEESEAEIAAAQDSVL